MVRAAAAATAALPAGGPPGSPEGPQRSGGAAQRLDPDKGGPHVLERSSAPYTDPVLEQAIRLASGKSRPLFRPLEFLYGWFEDAGCRAYVKTVYVGFDLNGYLVGAIYVRGAEYLEVAVALPADDRFPGLYPADHLKWASLPVAFQVRPGDDLTRLVPVLERTLDRARHILTSNPLG